MFGFTILGVFYSRDLLILILLAFILVVSIVVGLRLFEIFLSRLPPINTKEFIISVEIVISLNSNK